MLDDPSNELALAFSQLVNGLTVFGFQDFLTTLIPAARSLVSASRSIAASL